MTRRQYTPQLRIGDGPWYTTGNARKTYREALALGAMLAQWWLGVAESDVEESESIVKRESLKALKLKHRKNLNELASLRSSNQQTEESYVQRTLLPV